MKKDLIYVDQVSVLAVAGTLDQLRAIAYYNGRKGRLGTAARDVMSMGITQFLSNLSPAERKRFDEILASVKVASAMKVTGRPESETLAG